MGGRGARRFYILPRIALLAVLLLPLSAAADGALVILGGYQLNPRAVELAVGEQVTFQVQAQEDAMVAHTIVGDDFRSPPLEPGDQWTLTLTEPGVYRYRLEERPSVEGTITVR